MWSTLLENEYVRTAAPVIGAAGGALLITAAVERSKVPRERAALGTAAIALAASTQVTGAVKDLLIGAAAAGACIGVLEFLQARRPRWLYGDAPPAEQHRQAAPPPGVITSEDLQTALSDFAARQTAEMAEREKVQSDQIRQLVDQIRVLCEQLRNANTEVATLRRAAANVRRERDAALARLHQNAQTADAEVRELPILETTGVALIPAENVLLDGLAHLRAIYALLDDRESAQLTALIAKMSRDELADAESRLLSLTPEEAVVHLRRFFLAAAREAA